MPILALDLDLTTLVNFNDLRLMNKSHSLSAQTYQSALVGADQSILIDFYIINPEKLAKLIEEACTKYDGVIILTAGDWSPGVVYVLANALNLSEAVRQKLCDSRHFHSPEIDSRIFGVERLIIRKMDKCSRLKLLTEHTPELKDKHIILVDDNPGHVHSCRVNAPKINVNAVWAKDAGFYDLALAALASGVEKETKLDGKEQLVSIDIEKTPEPSLSSSSSVTPKQLSRSKSSPSFGGFFCPCNRKAHQDREALSASHSGPGQGV